MFKKCNHSKLYGCVQINSYSFSAIFVFNFAYFNCANHKKYIIKSNTSRSHMQFLIFHITCESCDWYWFAFISPSVCKIMFYFTTQPIRHKLKITSWRKYLQSETPRHTMRQCEIHHFRMLYESSKLKDIYIFVSNSYGMSMKKNRFRLNHDMFEMNTESLVGLCVVVFIFIWVRK